MLAASFGVATVTEPMARGREPYSLERRMQIRSPPIDTRTRSRTVWSSILSSGSSGSAVTDCGLAAQVAIQAFRGAATSCGATRRKQTRAQFRSPRMRWTPPGVKADVVKIEHAQNAAL